jgi:prepilin-type N-terminal cleavage/methylation domain-containing protein
MKTPSLQRFSNRSGFTLVELLVVMGIIAILAGVLLGAGGAAIKSAQRAKASQLANSLQTAALAYYTEYNVYPIITPSSPGTDVLYNDADVTDWPLLVEGLCGNINPASPSSSVSSTTTKLNTRNVPFLSLKVGDLVSATVIAPKNPLPPPNSSVTFNIAFDGDYDGILGTSTSGITMPNFATGTSTNLTLSGGTSTGGVAVWVNCTGAAAKPACNSAFWIHTY